MRGPTIDLKSRILDRVTAMPAAVWTPIDFLDLGARAAVDKALQRLVKTGQLERLDRGLYYQSRGNGLTPDMRAVVDAVSRRDQTRLVIDGMTAANDLGLTTALPTRIIVLSDARLRPIQLGNQQITFKQAAPSKLYWAGHPAMRIVQALHWLQDLIQSDQADDATSRLHAILCDSDLGQALRDDLRDGLPTLPTWMQNYLRSILDKTDPTLSLPLGRPNRRQTRETDPRRERGGA